MTQQWSKDVFSRNLKRYMAQAGISQKELAKKIGVSAPTFNGYVKGEFYPRIDKIQKLADYFGILKSDLIEDKSIKEKDNNAIADAVIRMQIDSVYLSVVTELGKLDDTQLEGILSMVKGFTQNSKN